MSTTPATGWPATHIRGARMHNLQGIDCAIPCGRITVVTGVSGSGKSTLAFDVLYAEGQRRFVECLSAYARQFMERLERPEVEEIGRIQPPIALKQRTSIKNARSTVGSITELSDYLRLLFAHAADIYCLECGASVAQTGVAEAIEAVRRWPVGTRLAVVAPLSEAPTAPLLRRLRAQGFARLLRGTALVEVEELLADGEPNAAGATTGRRRSARPRGGPPQKERWGIVIDRLVVGRTRRSRIGEAVENAWALGENQCWLEPLAPRKPQTASSAHAAPPDDAHARDADRETSPPRVLRGGVACTRCGAPALAPQPALFSWNSPLGACPECQGFGRIVTIDRDKVVPDRRKNLRNHAVVPFSVPSARAWYRRLLRAAGERGIPTDVPFDDLAPEQQEWVYSGDAGFPGVTGFFQRREKKRYKMHVRIFIARFRGYARCPVCAGTRLRPEALAARVGGADIAALHAMPLAGLQRFLGDLRLPRHQRARVRPLLESIERRLTCLLDVGVGYLTLARSGRTLSGGETQRIRIAAALGNSLTDTLFILDEPTVGLHATDVTGMLAVLRRMSAEGNTVVVVEHDPAVIEAADHLIVLGPGGGRQGGRLVYEGPPARFLGKQPTYFVAAELPGTSPPPGSAAAGSRRSASRTRRGSSGARAKRRLAQPWDPASVERWLAARAQPAAHPPLDRHAPRLVLHAAAEHNLRIDQLVAPLAGLTVISGVSGSGKSTLLDAVIHRNWLRAHGRPVEAVGQVDRIEGLERIEEVHFVGQEALGRSSRSNPLSFVHAYGDIRQLLAGTLDARRRKLAPGAFSFNTPGGRCEACRGMGTQSLEMYFLPDVEVACEACGGARFEPEVLAVTWRGKNIAQILELTVAEASAFFASEPRVVERLAPLREVGLGYLVLGQSTATLSGGEAQRLKIAAFLAGARARGRHLFLFDEPTTGLHARDIGRLLYALRSLTANGHAVFAVEHHLDFIRAADWVIDLGPGPGAAGGRVVHAGPVTALLEHPASATAVALRAHLERCAAWRTVGERR